MDLSGTPKARKPRSHSRQVRRLTPTEASRLIERYEAGATVYELATQFAISRTTVARKLRVSGVATRGRSPCKDEVDQMVELYNTGLTLAAVGQRLGFAARTVQYHVQERGVQTRDTHGRDRS